MTDNPDSLPSRDQRLEQVLAKYLYSVEAGHPLERQQLLGEHADLADELRLFFGNRDALEQLAQPFRVGSPSVDEPTIGFAGETGMDGTSRVRYFGDYELLGEIARGGMGVVYRARQKSLNRLVALKMILTGQLASDADVQRFQREAEAAANLDHPHIVPIYEIGEHEGQHYFSMKLIEGGSVAQLLREHPSGLPLRDSAKLMVTVARAVHHAHQRGLLHRDLKPSNILLDAAGAPQVTDFGLATRVEGGSDLTGSGSVVGTPNYMAPEQARAQKQLSTEADVYSLGAILYELLSGRPPFRGATAVDTIMQVLSREPQQPRSVNPRIDRDLETICLKCLEKEPQRRYDSAAALADDLDRWLRGEPILARPAGKMERTVKWARRHPSVAALSAALLLVLFVGFSLVTWKWQEASNRADAETLAKNAETQAKEAAGRALERAQQHAFTSQLWRAVGLIDLEPAMAAKALDDQEVCPPERRDFAWRYYRQLCHRLLRRLATDEGTSAHATVAPDGARFATVTDKDEICLWNVASNKPEAVMPGHGHTAFQALAFSPDGKTLATGGADGLVKLWNVPDGKLAATLIWKIPDVLPRYVMCLAFSPNGKTLAVGGGFFDKERADKDRDRTWRKPVVWVWDVATRTGKILTSTPRLKGNNTEDSGVTSLA
jgi:predicted Ser/Thr protein kinase